MKALVVALAVTYPFLAHYALAVGRDGWLVASVVVLLLVILLPALARGSRAAIVFAALAVAALIALVRLDLVRLVLFVPPIAITGALALLFARSLRGTPLITQLVVALHPPDDPHLPNVRGYTRKLTAIWAALLGLICLANVALALLATPGGVLASLGFPVDAGISDEAASLFSNLLGYVLIAGLFLVEYAFRKRIFPNQPYRNFVDFAQRVARVAPHVFRR